MRKELVNWPNFFTLVRILLIPVVVVFLTDPGPRAAIAATGTFFLASLSDFLDGYLARRYGLSTTLGKILDPLADKLIVAAVLVMLVAMGREPQVPGWAVAVMISREIAVTGLRAVALAHGVVVEAETLGKYKMVLQMFALHGLLLHYPFFGIDFFSIGLYFFWLALAVGVWSGVEYFRHVLPQLWRSGAPASLPR
ncbi:MAG: CDP-diacylglycerol--glycerol-3-phosphate 3-phosphatidyltransferase [Candidatus Binatia bacterium]|nr:CDP-diacylglycerol--glycerol-3-phosphate 3-phosphatidyltransferase [Candidatus Binatia bacterium]